MTRIAILAPLGWCVRDWVLSDFLPTLTQKADVVVFTPTPEALRDSVDLPGVQFEKLEVAPLGRWATELATAIEYAHFYRVGSFIQRTKLERERANLPLQWRMRVRAKKAFARRVLQRFGDETLNGIEKRAFGLSAESKRLEHEFRRLGIEMVFSTMPLIAHYERPALWAAQALGLPTACAIASWDNLHSKGRLPVRFDHYFVWSEQMRKDLRAQYPEIADAQVSTVGAAQFDYYSRPDLRVSREDFLRQIGGDPARPLILWTGVSPNQLPNEPELVAMLAEQLRRGAVQGEPQLLVRPHPIGGGSRFQPLREKYPEILFTETNTVDVWYQIRWAPALSDTALLVNSIAHADVNVNHCSTITLDCCALDRPVINLAFDVTAHSDDEAEMRACFDYEHYRCVTQLGAVRRADTIQELVMHLNSYLANPALEQEGRRRLLELQCSSEIGTSARRTAEKLLQLAAAESE